MLDFWAVETQWRHGRGQFALRYRDTVYAFKRFRPAYALESVGFVLRATSFAS